MEYIEWAIQLKNLATSNLIQMRMILESNLSSLQTETAGISLAVIVCYSILPIIKNTNQRKLLLIASLSCATIAYTPIYNYLDAVQYHAIFAIIYTSLTYLVKLKKTKVACCMLGSFQTIMAWDSWANANTETFIWTNYEVIVCLLHALIIGSFLERDVERTRS